jgi:hypothetical protein
MQEDIIAVPHDVDSQGITCPVTIEHKDIAYINDVSLMLFLI